MRTSTTFSILFWIYAKRAKNNQTGIYARISVNGKKVNISLKQKVDVDKWDAKGQKMKGNCLKANKLNQYLDEIKSDIVQCYRDLKSENRVLTAELVKARYLGEDKKNHTLLDIFEYHNENMTHNLADCTIGKFLTTQKYLLVYVQEKYKRDNMFLQNLDYEFVLGFESFLRKYRSRPSQGTIGNNVAMKHIQRLKKMIRLAYEMDWIQRDPFTKFKLKYEKKEREFLTKQELKKVEELITSIERLTTVRDLFVFSCYTGLSYIDVINLSQGNIVKGDDGNKWIKTKRQKTGVPVKIPLLEQAEKLIINYKEHPRTENTNRLFPHMSNQKLNSYLKEIADLCEISKSLTFHMARHTFATTITLTNNVPVETVSKLLGHTKIATTQIYAQVVENKISNDMNNLKTTLKVQNQHKPRGSNLKINIMQIVR
ncbi:site-specific recombinase XerD [Seonamhaeicola aphaedonensis]|uniref:Site-specific recombinase XerD n=2 Tax=Seonamhaeicola aphaedonensis TaxID=1461338 RepID=A0A3D9H5C5_9FLAO|nr:site-specific recombinase XerD [Seonamhaeicola aphaedonensis]